MALTGEQQIIEADRIAKRHRDSMERNLISRMSIEDLEAVAEEGPTIELIEKDTLRDFVGEIRRLRAANEIMEEVISKMGDDLRNGT